MSTTVNSSTSSSSSTLSSLSAKTGMAGLVSGLDTDSLVESLTSASRSRIAKEQQSVTKMEWKQTAYRNVSKALKEFQSKYLDVLSSTNMRSTSTFNTVTASTDSTKVSVSASSSASAGSITIDKITQLATSQTITGVSGVSTPLTGTTSADITGLLDDITNNGSNSFLLKLDGKVRTITLDSAFVTAAGTGGVDFQTALQDKIDDAFGTKTTGGSVVNVTLSSGKLGFSSNGSQLTINALNSDTDTLSKLGFSDGQTDRLTLTSTLGSSPFAKTLDAGGQFSFKINNVDFSFSSTDSLSTVISRINNSSAGVNLGYSSITDKFTLTAQETGAGGNIVISETSPSNLMNVLGLAGTENTDMITTAGKNAELTVNGQAIVRTSNSLEVDGVKVELLGTSSDAIAVNKKEDATSLKDTIKNFVTDYNNMIEMMNKLVKENSDSDYPPLTDDQKADMSETEITNWETKAKVGLLEGDSILKGITSKMQTMIYSTAVSGGISLYDMGITSAGYSENGKLTIDEDKLETALATKGSQIKELFTTDSTGLANKLNDIINGAVKTSGAKGTRGSLIEVAGYESTTSDTENGITSNITKINKRITELKDKLEDEETYYWNKFSALETALQQLNSQSSMLSQFSSGA